MNRSDRGKLEVMEFVTLHELSTQFDLPARVVRYRFHQLRDAGKLVESLDWRRDDFVDEQHFVWKINPLSFIRETGLKPVAELSRSAKPEVPLATTSVAPVNQSVNHTASVVNEKNNSVNQSPIVDTKVGNPPEIASAGRRYDEELIDVLKEQVRIKDEQLREHRDQLKEVTDMNVKLMGATLQQSQKLEDLLRLGPARTEPVTTDGNRTSEGGNDADNQTGKDGNHDGNQIGDGGNRPIHGQPSDRVPVTTI